MTEIVLIHGAWQGGWVWADVVPRLTEAGHACHAVDLPGSAPDIAGRAKITFRDQVAFLEELKSMNLLSSSPIAAVGLLRLRSRKTAPTASRA